MYVTVFVKTNHSVQIIDFELLVPHCSVLTALRNGEVRIAIVYTVPE